MIHLHSRNLPSGKWFKTGKRGCIIRVGSPVQGIGAYIIAHVAALGRPFVFLGGDADVDVVFFELGQKLVHVVAVLLVGVTGGRALVPEGLLTKVDVHYVEEVFGDFLDELINLLHGIPRPAGGESKRNLCERILSLIDILEASSINLHGRRRRSHCNNSSSIATLNKARESTGSGGIGYIRRSTESGVGYGQEEKTEKASFDHDNNSDIFDYYWKLG